MNNDPSTRPEQQANNSPGRLRRHLGRTFGVGAGIVGITVLAACGSNSGTSSEHGISTTPRPTETSQAAPRSIIDRSQMLEDSGDPRLKELGRYANDGINTNEMMLFMSLPTSESEGQGDAIQMGSQIQTWEKDGVKPVIIMESDSMNLSGFESGRYDAALHAYFTTLKRIGVKNLGIVVPFSEGNILPEQVGATGPAQYVANINRYIRILRQTYPDADEAEVSILLSNQTFGRSWGDESTSTEAILPYAKGLDTSPTGVSSLIIEGFPYSPRDESFIEPDQIVALAKSMGGGIKKITINTGVWSKMVNPNSPSNVPNVFHVSNGQREAWLNYILAQARAVEAHGYHVDINLFAQNNFQRLDTATATFNYSGETQRAQLKKFTGQAARFQMPVPIFDTTGN